MDNYSWRALLGGRLPRPHFLDLDRAPGNGYFLLQFVFKTDLKPVLVTLGPFGIHLGISLSLKIRILAAIPKRFLRIWRFAGTQNSHYRCDSKAILAKLAHNKFAISLRLPSDSCEAGASLALTIRILAAIPKRFLRISRFAGTQN
jgi:hypothetical protein